MTKRILIGIVLLAVVAILVGMYCCLVVASKADNAMEMREDRHHDCY